MENLRQLQIMKKVIQVLIDKIAVYTSRGFAANLVSKAILTLRDEKPCFNHILINEMRYEEGLNTFTVSEDINYVDSYEFYSAVKALIEKTMICFDENIDIHFVNDLRKDIPDIFYAIDNLNQGKYHKNKIMFIDSDLQFIEEIKEGFSNDTNDYDITIANSSVECFDFLASGYSPDLIVINIMMAEDKGHYIYSKLKDNSTWKNIPIILLTKNQDSSEDIYSGLAEQDYIIKPFEIKNLKKTIDKVLNRTKND